MKKRIAEIIITVVMTGCLCGCAEENIENNISTEETTQGITVSGTDSEAEVRKGEATEEYIVDDFTMDDLTEWEGEGEWKSNNVKYLGQCQYYKGKFYYVDPTFNESIGEEFPVEEVTYFLFTDDVLYFMKNDGKHSYNEDGCYDLYQYDLRTKEQTLLENSVSGAAYEDGIILYNKFETENNGTYVDLIVGKIDETTHEKIDEVRFEKAKEILGYDCKNVYFLNNRYYCFSFEDGTTTPVSELEDSVWLRYVNGNIWSGKHTTGSEYAYAELYQQGDKCGRVIYYNNYNYYEKNIWFEDCIFYPVDGYIMEYNLKNGSETKVCKLSSYGFGLNELKNVVKCDTGEYIIEERIAEVNEVDIPVYYYYLVDAGGNKSVLAEAYGHNKPSVEAVEENIEEKVNDGMVLTQEILHNPDVPVCISQEKGSKRVAYLDADNDGECEQIILVPFYRHKIDHQELYEGYTLCVLEKNEFTQYSDNKIDFAYFDSNRCVYNVRAENLEASIYAVSLDGEHITLFLYDNGPSGDSTSYLWNYDGKLTNLGTIYSDLRYVKLEDEKIYAYSCADIIQTDSLVRIYTINYEEKCIEEVPQDEYMFYNLPREDEEFRVELMKDLDVYEGKSYDSNKTVMKPQKVYFRKCSSDYKWVYIIGEDGTQGWFELDDREFYHSPKQYEGLDNTEVFDNLGFAG